MAKPEPHHLTRQIVIAMLAGIVLGVVLNQLDAAPWIQMFVVDGLLQVVGSVFVAALKMMVVPLVFVSLVVGVTALSDMMRTVCNVTGDCVVSCIVAKSEQSFDQAVFDDPNAGSVEAATRHSISTPPVP